MKFFKIILNFLLVKNVMFCNLWGFNMRLNLVGVLFKKENMIMFVYECVLM